MLQGEFFANLMFFLEMINLSIYNSALQAQIFYFVAQIFHH